MLATPFIQIVFRITPPMARKEWPWILIQHILSHMQHHNICKWPSYITYDIETIQPQTLKTPKNCRIIPHEPHSQNVPSTDFWTNPILNQPPSKPASKPKISPLRMKLLPTLPYEYLGIHLVPSLGWRIRKEIISNKAIFKYKNITNSSLYH